MVEDSGVGIPEEKREAMFQPFVRGTEKRGEGLGLGLVAGAAHLRKPGLDRQLEHDGAQWLPLRGGSWQIRDAQIVALKATPCLPV